MKNKTLSYIVVFVLVLISFFGGSYFEKQKSKSSPTHVISLIQNQTVTEVGDGDTLKLSNGKTFNFFTHTSKHQGLRFWSLDEQDRYR